MAGESRNRSESPGPLPYGDPWNQSDYGSRRTRPTPPVRSGRLSLRPTSRPNLDVDQWPRRPGWRGLWDLFLNRRPVTNDRRTSSAIWVVLVSCFIGGGGLLGAHSDAAGNPTSPVGGIALALILISFGLAVWRLLRHVLRRLRRRLARRRANPGPL